MALTTLANIKLLEGISDTSQDARLTLLLATVSANIRRRYGLPIESEVLTQRLDGPPYPDLVLDAAPVLATPTPVVTENGAALVLNTDYEIRGRRLIRLSAGSPIAWLRGTLNVSASYSAGYATVPSDFEDAAIMQIRHVFHLGAGTGEQRLGLSSKALSTGGDLGYVAVQGELLAGVLEIIEAHRAQVALL